MILNTCLKRLTFQIYDDTYYFCLILNNSMEKVWSLLLSFVWVRKLKLRGVEWLSWGHTARAQVSQNSSVFFLADQEGSYKQGRVPGSWWVACSHCSSHSPPWSLEYTNRVVDLVFWIETSRAGLPKDFVFLSLFTVFHLIHSFNPGQEAENFSFRLLLCVRYWLVLY